MRSRTALPLLAGVAGLAGLAAAGCATGRSPGPAPSQPETARESAQTRSARAWVQGRDGADHAGRASAYDPTSLERSSADTVARERREEARQRQERAAREEEEAKRAREEARRATPQTEASP